MADSSGKVEDVDEVEHTSDPAPETTKQDDSSGSADERVLPTSVVSEARSRLIAPEIIRNLTPEQRDELERRLKRKIDWRLMPAIIIMYILNYIDR
jgi:hypothetical protein